MERQPSQLDLVVQLGILSQLFSNRMSTLLTPFDLTSTQLALLNHLARRRTGQSISELASALEIQQPGMTKVVQRLESQGLVTSQPDHDDPRRKLVSISTAGHERRTEVGRYLSGDVERWFADWSTAELNQLSASLGRLIAFLDGNRL